MAYIEPNTEIRFLTGVPLDPDYENTLYFDNREQQANYFLNKTQFTFNNQSYQRKNRGWLRVGFPADVYGGSVIRDLYHSTYMMFKNTNYENKWFYAFVDKVEYVNNNTVDVQYHIDVMQTWHFDYVFNQCFIEREHTATDVAGANTIPEQLETGPYMEEKVNYWYEGDINNSGAFEYNPGVCLVTSFDPAELYSDGLPAGVSPVPGRIIYGYEAYGDLYSAAYYTYWPLSSSIVSTINDLLTTINNSAQKDGVVALFMFPYDFRGSIEGQGTGAIKSLTFSAPTSIGSYTPRNKKLLTSPYTFLYVSNNQGGTAEYMYEFFSSSSPVLRVWGNVSPNGGMVCWPVNYKGYSGGNMDEALSLTGFPMCSWANDSFKAWLAQNAGTIGAAGLTLAGSWASLVSVGPAALAGGGGGDPLGLVGGANNTPMLGGAVGPTPTQVNFGSPSKNLIGATLGAIGQLYDHKRRPPQMNGDINLSLSYQNSTLTFYYYNKHIREEYARIIDQYFDMYGYATHRVGTPNRMARRCYNFVKTVGCSIAGNVPADDTSTIQALFNRGIRFWRHTAVFGNYDPSVNNNQV